MADYNSSHVGNDIDNVVDAVQAAVAADGIVNVKGLNTILGNYLTSSSAANIYLTSSNAASTYVSLKTTSDTGVFLRGDNTWSSTLTGRLYLTTIAQTANDYTGQLSITSASTLSDGSYFSTIASMAPNVGNSQHLFMIGTARSVKNSGYYGFHYSSSGSDSNYLTMGLYGIDKILNITGAGNVGIGTTEPTAKLHVNGKILTDRGGYVPCTKLADGSTITDLINEVRYSQGQMGSVSIGTSTHGVPTGWYNYLYIPHRVGFGNDNMNYGTLLLFYMTSNTGTYYQIHLTNGTINNAISK